MMYAFFRGISWPLRAFGVLARMPQLWRFVLVPIGVNLAVGVTLYATLLLAGLRAIDGAVAGLPEWATFLGGLLRLLLMVLLLIATGFVLVRFGVVLGAPWYARLSDQLELARRLCSTICCARWASSSRSCCWRSASGLACCC